MTSELKTREIEEAFGPTSKLYKTIFNYLKKKEDQEQKFTASFSKWKEIFKRIYESANFSELFLKQTYYIFIVKGFYIYRFMLINKESHHGDLEFQTFLKLYNSQQLQGNKFKEFELYHWTELNNECLRIMFDRVGEIHLDTPEMFHLLYQKVFSVKTRHFIGEFYTPSTLVKKMVEDTYNVGDKVLDPSCGSGNFLIEIIMKILEKDITTSAKIDAIKHIYGFDINPIAIYTVKIQILLILYKRLQTFPIEIIDLNFILMDALSCESTEIDIAYNFENLFNSFDLVIGNPPWLTYKDADNSLRKKMKEISAKFHIKPDAHNITNIEEAVIFLYYLPFLFLKRNGNSQVAFVMPKSILVSSHNQKARTFNIFKSVEIIQFDDALFNIDFCCVLATLEENPANKGELTSQTYPINCKVYNTDTMELLEDFTLEPYVYFQSSHPSQYLVKKLIKSERKNELLPCSLSDYYDKFIQGADLLPKSLLYVNILNKKRKDQDLCVIDPWISPQAKGKWKRKYFSQEKVECKYLFKATLSRGLYPFYINPYDVFLPLNDELKYNPTHLGPFAQEHWTQISSIYEEINEKDLFSRGINYRNKLCKKNRVRAEQRKPYKVVFPNAKTLMAAVIKDPKGQIFIDSTLYYYGTENEKEAYYLCGMLNIRDLYKSVKLISDTRHHHKRPLYFYIPEFQETDTQLRIASLAQQCTSIVEKYLVEGNKPRVSQIWNKTAHIRREINNLGLTILTSVEGIDVLRI